LKLVEEPHAVVVPGGIEALPGAFMSSRFSDEACAGPETAAMGL
jgi:hypothetical protein